MPSWRFRGREPVGYSEIISTVALLIAGSTFVRNLLRDRPRIQIKSAFYDGSESAEFEPNPQPSIQVVVVNTGTRPVILRVIGGADDKGRGSGRMIEYEKGGTRLGKHERWEHTIKNEDTVDPYSNEPEDILFTHMWIEDSLGNRHLIPDSYDLVPKLQATLFVRAKPE
jgi:hypothetical protein